MKRRKCFKTILSGLLAAAMLVTAAPVNSFTVSAAQVETEITEETPVSELSTVPEPEGQTGTVEVPEISNDGVEGDGEEGGGTTEPTEPSSEEPSEPTPPSSEEPSEPEEPSVEGENFDKATTHSVAGKKATFTCKPTDAYFATWNEGDQYIKADTIKKIIVKGSTPESNGAWSELGELQKGEDGNWTLVKEFALGGKYEYKFFAKTSEGDDATEYYAVGDNKVFYTDCLLDTIINVPKGETFSLAEKIKGYKDNVETDIAVLYELSTESASHSDKIKVEGTKGSQTLTIADDLSDEVKSFTLTATETDTGSTCTVTVQIGKGYERDENHASPKVEAGKATFYYFGNNGSTEEVVNIHLGSGDDWYTTPMVFDDQTGYWSVTLPLAVGEYDYGFKGGIAGNWDKDVENQVNSVQADKTQNCRVKITTASSIVTPKIEGNKVTFLYELPTVDKVVVVGTMTSWEKNPFEMTKNEAGTWEATMTLPAGVHEYKFIVGTDSWRADPWNEKKIGGNNAIYIAGLADGTPVNIIRGGNGKLPEKLALYDEAGNSEDVAVTYALSAETNAAAWKDKIELKTDEQGATTVTVASDLPIEVESFTLTAKDANGNTSTVTVNVPSKLYKYTIYYYDDEHYSEVAGKDSAALWIWTDGVNGILYPFTGTEEIDGKTWLKAEVDLTYTDVHIIPRNATPAEVWSWQDEERVYSNEAEAESTTLYMVFDDGTKIYTEKPEVKTREKRYLVVEYERNDGSADDWYFYTWNNGYTGFYPFKKVDGVWKAEIPVKQNLSSISYCIEKGGDKWLEKDGNDYLCAMPVDQNVVKIKMSEGQGITYTYPYNIGYEMEPQEDMIHFYYRNDDAFRKGSKGGFQSVEIEINGTLYTMDWDAKDQRYTYDYENLEPGTYKYRYALKATKDSTAEYVLDKYNENKVTENNIEYSVCEYQLFDAQVQASVLNPNMDYNDNNVLTIKFTGKDGADITKMKASAASADLSELGGKADTAVDPELLALSIAVKEGTAAGIKTIPVTVYDQYGNGYTAETTVNVVDRNKANDFDWDEAVIYFAVTDRFFDGNAANNGLGYDTNAATGPSSYHGGDFAGLTQKLDYLKDLGVNTIWITPIVEQQPTANVDTATGISAWGYHGYWAKNFENLDSHLGTEAEFKALLDAAHAKGMKIMVDVVLNHSGYNAAGSTDLTDYFDQKVEGGMFRTADETVNGSDQQSSLSGLPDFRTEDPEVRALLVEWQSKWISKYDIDYYRVDTVKHVDDTTWSAFKNALTTINPDFKMIGEWAGAGYATDTGMLRSGRMDSLLDFDYNDRAVAFVNGDMSGTESFLTARNASIDNTATLGAFLSSHDEDGLVQKLIDSGKTEAKALELAKVAASLQLTGKGQVIIYYGEEVGQYGKDNYPYQTNRYDFDWARTEASANNATLAHYKKLLAVRNQYLDVFAKGSRTTIVAEDTKGLDVFARSHNGTTLTVALNVSETEQKFVLSGWQTGVVLKDLYSGKEYEVKSDGTAEITIPAAADGGTAILIGVKRSGDTEEVVTPDLQAGFDVRCVEEMTYTGKNITLSETQLRVYNGLTELKRGTDYTVKYKNNKIVGTATVTVTGKGNYKGKATTTFNIVPKDIKDTDIVYQDAMIATGGKLKPLSKITHNGIKLGTKDYKAEYFALDENGNKINANEPLATIKDAGDYELVITALRDEENNKGNFTGSTTKKIKVYAKGSVSYMKNTTITLSQKSYEYTGAEIVLGDDLTVKAKSGSKPTLIPDTDYKVSYENNVEVGTATVIITGIPKEGGYIGSVTKTFKITGVKLSSVAQVDETNWQQSVVYDVVSGKAVQSSEVGLQAKNGTDTFTEGKDYTVSYQKNDKPGSATMVFTGKGKYTGTVTKKFTVAKINLTADDVRLKYTVAATAPYAKKGAKAAVTVKYDGIQLREGVDYKLTYGNNKAVTTDTTAENKLPNVKITGIGAFAGNIQNTNPKDAKHTTFSIVKSDIGTLKLTAVDKVFKNSNGAFISAPVLTEDTGAKLANNKDYEVKYYVTGADGIDVEKGKTDTVAVGENGYTTVKMVATAKGNSNYVGTITAEYRVVTANISKASVKVNAKVYTGKAITLDEQDFTKIKVGTTDLVYGKDYEIVKDSYVNNIKKGTASVTIKGLGNYGGTKKVTFKITNRTIAWWWNLLQ